MTRKVGVVTVARSDYGIYRSILRGIQAESSLELMLFVGGMHLSPEFGLTLCEIERDGFYIAERVEMLLSSDSPQGVSKAIGLGMIGFAQAFARTRPDILLVLGDRFEMFAAASAALPFKIPLAHIHGGETTQGAIDESLRHAITKMSHLHFVSTQTYANRIVQMGEVPWRVIISGAPALDMLVDISPMSEIEFEQTYGVCLTPRPLLVTYHPVTLEYEETAVQVGMLLDVLREVDMPVIFTEPNADTGGSLIRQQIREFVTGSPSAWLVPNLGQRGYFAAMRFVAAMVGNSSSGLIEAPSFKLPVVNIGTRQDGRIRAANVIDVGYSQCDIVAAIRRAVSPEFRAMLTDLVNPYGDGHAAERIVAVIKSIAIDDRLLRKTFHDGDNVR